MPLDDAVAYARAGWRVMPIWWVEEVGEGELAVRVCGCGNPHCPAPGKHPLIKTGRGLAGASSSVPEVREWFTRWPKANIAVACGRETGVVVIDCDITDDHDGFVEYMSWAAELGIDLPETLTAETGSGGRHLLYAYPGVDPGIRNLTAWLPDVDVKSDGGYILVAPSTHKSGRAYRWLSAQGTRPAVMPPGLVSALQGARSKPGPKRDVSGADQPVYDYREAVRSGPRMGQRDHFFNARAFELRRSGMTAEDAARELRRSWDLCEQRSDDVYPWDAVVDKLRRVWSEVEPEPIPSWDPLSPLSQDERRAAPRPVGIGNEPLERSFTDQGNAWRLITEFGSDIRWTEQAGWYIWDGMRWVRDEMSTILELSGKTLDRMAAEAFEKLQGESRDAQLEWVRQSRSRRSMEAMTKLVLAFPDVKMRVTEFDRDPWILCCPNGTIDLRTGELKPHRREDYVTKMSPVRYDAGAFDDRWDRYLKVTTGSDDELTAYLRRAAGYSLTGSTREEALFMLYGPTASGKSTFIVAMQTILGDYAMTVSPEVFMHKRGLGAGAPKDELAAMRGARLVASLEPSEGDRFAEGLVKSLTGGDKITGRHLYRDRFEFEPTFKLWIAANAAPRARDAALFRRIRRVPFPRTVPAEERDLTLKEEWLKVPESPGSEAVLAWAVRGVAEWREVGLGSCSVVESDTEEYRVEQDVIGAFISDVMVTDRAPDVSVEMRDVYSAYVGWCDRVGERPWTQIALTRALSEAGGEHGFQVLRGGRRVSIIRCALRPEWVTPSWSPT